MKIFISWSGNLSRQVAELLKDWLPKVTDGVEVWLSTRDIDNGSQWFNEITRNLSETTQGIFCLTSENKSKPWILFEAGALAKGSQESRVYTFLVDLSSRDIEDPLAQFNHTTFEKGSILKLVKNINSSVAKEGQQGLRADILETLFSSKWDEFANKFSEIIESKQEINLVAPKRESADVIDNILDIVRGIDKTLADKLFSNQNTAVNELNPNQILLDTTYLPKFLRMHEYIVNETKAFVNHVKPKTMTKGAFQRTIIGQLQHNNFVKNSIFPSEFDILAETISLIAINYAISVYPEILAGAPYREYWLDETAS